MSKLQLFKARLYLALMPRWFQLWDNRRRFYKFARQAKKGGYVEALVRMVCCADLNRRLGDNYLMDELNKIK